MIKKIFSHILPVTLKKYSSDINGVLEVNLYAGRKMLDTSTSNFSYGSLQKILHRGLLEINFNSEITAVLLLGLEGGSVVEIIRKKFHSQARIDAVEIDPVVLLLAEEEFGVNRFENLRIFNTDAFNFVRDCRERYPLIIVDLFIGNRVPEIFIDQAFLVLLARCLPRGGKLIFNTMEETTPMETVEEMRHVLKKAGITTQVLRRVSGTNNLIVGVKK